jgi:membrane fusion protein, heavy metal efflux system
MGLDLGTILIVEGDVVLGGVLGRVLTRDGFKIVQAVNAAGALDLAERHAPRLALVGWRPRAGREDQGVEIAERLHARYPDLPIIAITDHAPRGTEDPSRPSCFDRILSKSVDWPDLRQTVKAVLDHQETNPVVRDDMRSRTSGDSSFSDGRMPRTRNDESQQQSHRWTLARVWALAKELSMPVNMTKPLKTVSMVVIALVVLAGLAMAMGGMQPPWQAKSADRPASKSAKTKDLPVELVASQPHTLFVPEDARKALGISTAKGDLIAVAEKPTKTRPIVMPGSTMLDPTRLYRIRARFAPSPSSAEVTKIAEVEDNTGPVTTLREIRSGDKVKKDDPLAVFHSVDVGNKKNDLIDATYQLELDQQILKEAEEHADAVPKVFLWNARRQVQGDINNVNRALATLRTWGISEKDIEAVLKEAEEVKKRQGKHNPEKDKEWPRVEMKAPDDGVIVERNLALHEIVADNTTNLFQIARVDRLAVLAYCPEDDLPELEKLTTPQRRWTVKTVGSPPVQGLIDDISYIIDPNQHTAVVKGHIDNPKEVLRAGQFISATVELPPPADVVEVPIDAVSEDGQQAVVFVLADPAKHHYTMRRVQLEARFEQTCFVRSKPFDKSVQRTKEEAEQGMLPKEPLRPGEVVLKTGVGELKAKLLDLESQPEKK